MVLELTNLPNKGGDRFILEVPTTKAMLVEVAADVGSNVIGTRITVEGLGTVICTESYDYVKTLVAKGLGGGVISGVKSDS